MVGANAACFPERRTVPPKADLKNEEAMVMVDKRKLATEEI
jgi:hypothetical protein